MVMKKYFYILLVMCSIVSCQQEEPEPESSSQGNGNGETTKGTGGIVGLITDISSHKAIDGAYVLLMPVGKVNSGTGSDGRYQFDNLQAKSDYKLNVFKEGYIREERTIAVTEGKTTTDEGNIGLHKNTGTISISKTFIDMGTTGIGAVFSINTGENKNLSWKIVADREWLTVDHQTGTGNSAINITLDRNKLSSVREDNHAVITVTSTTVGDGSYDELWVTVFGTGNGVNVGNISTQEAINVTTNSASVTGRVLNSGIQHDERGICYSKTPNPTIQNFVERDSKAGTGIYTVTLKDLSAGIAYYARAYAINNTTGNAYYGNEISFTTLNTNNSNAPTVLTGEAVDVTQKTAIVTGNIQSSGGSNVVQRGICYSKSHTPTTNSNKVTNGSGEGYFDCSLINLTPNTLYYARAFAVNVEGTSYGNEIAFSTEPEISDWLTIKINDKEIENNVIEISKETILAFLEKKKIASPDYIIFQYNNLDGSKQTRRFCEEEPKYMGLDLFYEPGKTRELHISTNEGREREIILFIKSKDNGSNSSDLEWATVTFNNKKIPNQGVIEIPNYGWNYINVTVNKPTFHNVTARYTDGNYAQSYPQGCWEVYNYNQTFGIDYDKEKNKELHISMVGEPDIVLWIKSI
ncbi:hypothetical protein AGMMS50239_32810 [Bacteroidia bacterium]|nr:hypothetical protein AGMMS50239_32810 [Bacteroidia bacterium]